VPDCDITLLPLKIREHVTVDPVSGCWVSSHSIDKDGYSRINGKGTHRAVWELLVGPIPPGLVLDHVRARGCLWNACCNPAHLEPVTQRVNVLRGHSFAAVNFAKDECINGHPFDMFNTYWRPNGHRDCRACVCARVAKYQRRIRAQDSKLRRAA
jgi:hypothetical protein